MPSNGTGTENNGFVLRPNWRRAVPDVADLHAWEVADPVRRTKRSPEISGKAQVFARTGPHPRTTQHHAIVHSRRRESESAHHGPVAVPDERHMRRSRQDTSQPRQIYRTKFCKCPGERLEKSPRRPITDPHDHRDAVVRPERSEHPSQCPSARPWSCRTVLVEVVSQSVVVARHEAHDVLGCGDIAEHLHDPAFAGLVVCQKLCVA